MKSKYAFLVVLGLAVAVAGYSYYDDVSFSSSDAAGYAVSFNHVEGTQSLTIGETVRIKWPKDLYNDGPSTIELVAYFGFEPGTTEMIEERYLIGTSNRNAFTWFVADEAAPGGIPRDTLLHFEVTRGGHNYISPPFSVNDWIGDPAN